MPPDNRSIWEKALEFAMTPQAPEITSPAREQHPWLTEAYERFVRPISSPVNAAITGATGPALKFATSVAPRLVG